MYTQYKCPICIQFTWDPKTTTRIHRRTELAQYKDKFALGYKGIWKVTWTQIFVHRNWIISWPILLFQSVLIIDLNINSKGANKPMAVATRLRHTASYLDTFLHKPPGTFTHQTQISISLTASSNMQSCVVTFIIKYKYQQTKVDVLIATANRTHSSLTPFGKKR